MKTIFGFIAVIAFVGGLYYGFIYFIKKGFKSNPQPDTTEATTAWQSQSDKAAEIQQRQRDLMRQRQDRMRDTQRR